MNSTIYNYPKTSCDYPTPANCVKFCDQTYPFRIQNNSNGMTFVNPSVLSNDKFDLNYRKINVKTCPRSSCSGITYLNSDPRLFNSAGETWLQLDRPPVYCTPKLNTLNDDKNLDRYGQGYKSYSDIKAGQILYYTDRNSSNINFSQKKDAICTPFTDPMSTSHPYLNITPKQDYNPITDDNCNVTGDDCLSWLRDSQFQRQDITSLQLHQINSTRRLV